MPSTCIEHTFLLTGLRIFMHVEHAIPVAYAGIFYGGGQQIQLTEDRENGDLRAVALGAVALWSGVLEAAVIWYKKFHFIW